MTFGIMQPYFLPYLGYFQLMKVVDTFIYYDDVTYIKGGWINRNNICVGGKDFRFTLEIIGSSSFKKINEIQVGGNRMKLFKTFTQAYSKAPHYNEDLLYSIFYSVEENLFKYIMHANREVINYLDLDISCYVSSGLKKDNSLHGKDKVLDICERYRATDYINAIGGQKLYSKKEFKDNGIDLHFLQSGDVPKRSIIDVIMNHPKEEIIEMFEKYTLV